MEDNDTSSSHASYESPEGYEDENVDVLVRQLDVNVLLAALLEEKCVSQDGERGRKLFGALYNCLEKNGVVKCLSHERENLLHTQKDILEKIMLKLAQNHAQEDFRCDEDVQITDIISLPEKYPVFNGHFGEVFECGKQLGEGSYGKVFKAKHILDCWTFAVKKIPLKVEKIHLKQNIDKALREARALASLLHPNIIKYHTCWLEWDSYEAGLMLYIQMELCDCTLRTWLTKRDSKRTTMKDYSTEEFLHPDVKLIFRQILCGVSFIHSKELMHRDLSSQNIFITGSSYPHVKIADFGIVKRVNDSSGDCSSKGSAFEASKTSSCKGHWLYGASELLNGETCDVKCDSYSLGVLLIEMCNTFPSMKQREKSMPEMLKNGECCPKEIERTWSELKITLMKRLISRDPKLRPTVEEVLNSPLFALEDQNQQGNEEDKNAEEQDPRSEQQAQENADKYSAAVEATDPIFGFHRRLGQNND